MLISLSLRCPHCRSSQYRTSVFDISKANPDGAKCIFCKSIMVRLKPASWQLN
nr:cold-shock protein [Izhakiella capsodis]